jgi:hypothetical protein
VRYEGLFATAGLPEPDPAAPPPAAFIAMAVGKTNEGASFPANPRSTRLERRRRREGDDRTQLREPSSAATNQSSCLYLRQQSTHLSMTTAGVWDAILRGRLRTNSRTGGYGADRV